MFGFLNASNIRCYSGSTISRNSRCTSVSVTCAALWCVVVVLVVVRVAVGAAVETTPVVLKCVSVVCGVTRKVFIGGLPSYLSSFFFLVASKHVGICGSDRNGWWEVGQGQGGKPGDRSDFFCMPSWHVVARAFAYVGEPGSVFRDRCKNAFLPQPAHVMMHEASQPSPRNDIGFAVHMLAHGHPQLRNRM